MEEPCFKFDEVSRDYFVRLGQYSMVGKKDVELKHFDLCLVTSLTICGCGQVTKWFNFPMIVQNQNSD